MIHLERPIIFIDLETTGTETLSDRIVELAALKIYPDGAEEIIITRINPGVAIPPEAIAVHGITDSDVADEPSFAEYAPELKAFLEGCDLGGFNVRRFDLEMIEAEFKRAGIEFSREGRHIIDAQSIYHKFEPRDLSVAHKKYCGKEIENRHSSAGDVRAAVDVFRSQLKTHPELPKTVKELHEFCAERRNENWLDSKGKFVWVDKDAVVNFGKYKGRTIQQMAEKERGFLEWMIKSDFMPDAKRIANDALNGVFPKRSG